MTITKKLLFLSLACSLHALSARGVVTYEQFGAVGDGKTDDRAAIVKAHAAAKRKLTPGCRC